MKDVYKQIIGFMDDLYNSIGLLAVAVEKHMKEKNFIPLKNAKDRINWKISHNINKPNGWRLSYLSRLYTHKEHGPDKYENSILYQIILETMSYFPFPCILCVKTKHKPSTSSEIYNDVWRIRSFNALSQKNGDWHSFKKETEWCIAEPSFGPPIKWVKGYFLNLFDINEPQKVYDNIILPLTSDTDSIDLSKVLTVKKYDFPGLE